MKFYMVVFDRKLTNNYRNFHKKFVEHPKFRNWWHYIKSSYIIETPLTATEIAEHFTETAKSCGIPTRHLVMSVDIGNRQGMLPKDAWKWFGEVRQPNKE